jgi:menaquinone-dependent protoporphyrinogen oxidase
MTTLIVYASKHGCTEKCAHKLQERITGEVEMLNLKKPVTFSPEKYDMIIIGGSIHAGKIQKRIKKFCLNHLDVLKKKN